MASYETIPSDQSSAPLSPVSATSRRIRRSALLILPLVLIVTLSFVFHSSSTSLSPFSLSIFRDRSSEPDYAEIPTRDCTRRLQCRAWLQFVPDPTSPYLEAGYLIRSKKPRGVTKKTKQNVKAVTQKQAEKWALALFDDLESVLPEGVDEEQILLGITDAIMTSKDEVLACDNTDEETCKPVHKIPLGIEVAPTPCPCPKILAPVCGADGITYDNECFAKCAGAEVGCAGSCPCPDVCPCPKILAPVCGADGITYDNECFAKCAGAEVSCAGSCPCKETPPCPLIYSPVCGSDGKTYDNSCFAKFYDVCVMCSGGCPCEKPAGCPKIYDPVCGIDDKTYPNACEAQMYGICVDCEGTCPCG